MTVINDEKKFSIEKCKKTLNKKGRNYSDEQVKKIRDFLYFLAELEYENFKKHEVHEKTSHPIHPRLH